VDGAVPYTTVDAFLDHWDGVRWVTLELLRVFDDADLSYRLVPQWRTVGELFHHIGGHQFYGCRGILLGRWDSLLGEADEDWGAHKPAHVHSVERLHAWLTEVQGLVREWAGQASENALSDFRPDNPWFEGMRGWLQLNHAYQDELHHRGQLYAIARVLNKIPPAVNAEEYPEFWNRKKWS
jgi:uncharacterized damage-inducible protein DinB